MARSLFAWGSIAALGLSLAMAVPAHGADVDFYVPGTETGAYTDGQGNSRDTHFRANTDVTLKRLGVHFDPLDENEHNVGTADGNITILWRIYGSDSEGRVFAPIFQSAAKQFADLGLGEYDTNVNIALSEDAYYILSMEVVTGAFSSLQHLENDQSLPLTTSDNRFEVFNGGNNNNGTTTGFFGNFNNAVLPAFSVSIPEPASLALIVGGTLLIARRRKR